MSNNDFSEKLRLLRKKHNLTLEQIANIVGVGKSTVRKWEVGMIANVRRDKIGLLAKALHTTPAYLMGWEEEKPPVNELSEDERRLIEIYRKISPEAGEMLLTMVNIFEEMPQDRAQMLLAMIRAGIENQG